MLEKVRYDKKAWTPPCPSAKPAHLLVLDMHCSLVHIRDLMGSARAQLGVRWMVPVRLQECSARHENMWKWGIL